MTQRYKTKAELASKVIRISIAHYALLSELSRQAGISMDRALGLVIELREQTTKVSPAQIPLPVFRVTAQPVIAVNGAGVSHSAFSIKPKGVKYE